MIRSMILRALYISTASPVPSGVPYRVAYYWCCTFQVRALSPYSPLLAMRTYAINSVLLKCHSRLRNLGIPTPIPQRRGKSFNYAAKYMNESRRVICPAGTRQLFGRGQWLTVGMPLSWPGVGGTGIPLFSADLHVAEADPAFHRGRGGPV
jgi:hypothetical protein